ncbi:MAG: hypothetical protein FWF40_00165 [Methanomassiliicoccaceae archaeon]|nr:hypothetical protein [Methanomassiliicoccaceae archaeon]
MDDERITLRMGTSDVQTMDDYLVEHPELGNRSQFIRTALREYMTRDGKSTPSDKSAIYVRLNETERMTLKMIIDKEPFLDDEEFVRHLLRKAISAKEEGEYAEFLVRAQEITM